MATSDILEIYAEAVMERLESAERGRLLDLEETKDE